MDSASTTTTAALRAGPPARSAVAGAILALACLLPASGTAQTVSRGETVGAANITLTGTITSTVVISVEGSVNQNGGANTMMVSTGAHGSIDFGNFRVPGPSPNGERHHVNGAEPGHSQKPLPIHLLRASNDNSLSLVPVARWPNRQAEVEVAHG